MFGSPQRAITKHCQFEFGCSVLVNQLHARKQLLMIHCHTTVDPSEDSAFASHCSLRTGSIPQCGFLNYFVTININYQNHPLYSFKLDGSSELINSYTP